MTLKAVIVLTLVGGAVCSGALIHTVQDAHDRYEHRLKREREEGFEETVIQCRAMHPRRALEYGLCVEGVMA